MISIETIGIIGGILSSCGGIPQIYKILQTKQTKDLSWLMLSMWNTGLMMSLIYGIKIDKFPIYLNCTISLISSLTITSLKIYYENKKYEIIDNNQNYH